jgi:CO/xanthine dehydrogenase Mo-binding subunit
MTTVEAVRLLGPGVDRVDGPLKVTGSAPYPGDFSYPNMAYAVLVRSTVAAGRIRRIDATEAEAAPGVLAVITQRNAPHLERGPDTPVWRQPPPPLQDDRILHYGQYIGVVVAETTQDATAAATLIRAGYEPTDPVLDLDDPRAEVVANPWGMDSHRGDVAAGLASADVTVEASYTTPDETNNPMGLFATVAAWDGDSLTVHDSTQWPNSVRATLAAAFGVPESGVRVVTPFVGGGFGAALRVWPHVVLAALAARTASRPVKLVLTRPQMFTGVGHRTRTTQRVRLAADRDGHLTALSHEAKNSIAMEDDNYEPVAADSATAYACPNADTWDVQARLNIPDPTSMRAPGQAQGNFALESTVDELAYALDLDPVELRLRNYAQDNQQLHLPWSSKALRACYEQGAARFGWWDRDRRPGSMRDAEGWLVGYGMAGVSFFWFQPPCQARASVSRDGTAFVRSAATDIGTGTYTVMTQLSAELLGLRLDQVSFGLGDTDMPMAAMEGGSGLTAALGSAVFVACRRVIQAFLDTVADDQDSPLRGCRLDGVAAADGRIHRVGEPSQGESYTDILARHGLDEVSADGASAPPTPQDAGLAPAGAFGARFVEIRVDPDLGRVRVARVVSAIDAGRILNEKTATSQVIGGTVGGIGMALLEETVTDPTGRIANDTLSDYLVPVNADIPDQDVIFVGEPDRFNPIGVKGVGEIGLVGMAAAIANAVFHATGRRIRSLPITLDQLL